MASKELSPDQRSDLDFITDEVRRLHTTWDVYEQTELVPRRTLLHARAGQMLATVGAALATDMVMTVSRLCDPAQQGHRKNLTFALYQDVLPSMKSEFGELDQLYKSDVVPIRNKRLGHNDLKVLRGSELVASPTIDALRRAVDLCTDILAALHFELAGTAVSFVPSSVPFELDWIEASLRLVDEEPMRIKTYLQAVRAD